MNTSGWAMALDLVYKMFEAFVLWRKQHDDWFQRRYAEKAAKKEAKRAARELEESVPLAEVVD